MHRHVLLPVDGSEGTRLAVAEVCNWGESMRPDRLTLLQVLGPYPPALLESGGSSDPEEERRQHDRLAQERRRWDREAEERARPVVEAALQGLHAAGYGKDVEVVHTTLIPEDDVARRVIEVARDHHCDRIVVGRSPGDDEGRLDASVVDKLEDLASGDVDTLVVG